MRAIIACAPFRYLIPYACAVGIGMHTLPTSAYIACLCILCRQRNIWHFIHHRYCARKHNVKEKEKKIKVGISYASIACIERERHTHTHT